VKPLLTVNDAAKFLAVAPSTIRKWIFNKRIPHVKVGRAVRLREGDLEVFINYSGNLPK